MMSPPSGFRGETATTASAGSTSTNSHPFVAVSAAADLVGGCGSTSSTFMRNSIPSSYQQPIGYATSSSPTTFGSAPTSTSPTYGYHPSAATTTSGGAGAGASCVVGASTGYPSHSVEEHHPTIDPFVALDGSISTSINIANSSNNKAMNPTLIASSSPYDNFHGCSSTDSSVIDTRDSGPVYSSFHPSADATMSSRSCATDTTTTTSPITGGSYDERRRPTRESVLRRLSAALMRRSLTTIDMSQRDLKPSDANLIKLALLQNKRLHTLKLGYNHLGDEGLITLSSALASSTSITSLDLGFTGVGDAGLEALANNISLNSRSSASSSSNHHVILPLQTLYLAGNAIGTRGALALARIIQFRCCHLKTLHLTGNKVGVDGIRSLTRAIAAISSFSSTASSLSSSRVVPPSYPIEGGLSPLPSAAAGGIEELFLGGTGLGSEGCHAVSEMLSYTPSLRVLSLADNNLGDREVTILADAIKENRLRIPLEALQLSFNRLTCIGVESLMNAVWGSTTLLELRLDNNHIGDRGAQLVSVVIATVRSLQRVDLGFNSFTATGMRSLMKSVSESANLSSLSISGNKLDTSGAKAVAYALAYNTSLKYFFMDNCAASHESQRHITAGIVSNSDVKLLAVTGFRIGAVAVTLGLPSALEHWKNEQVLKFILYMWEQARSDQRFLSLNPELDLKLRSSKSTNKTPLDPAIVVTVAKKAYESLGEAADSVRFSQSESSEPSFYCPLVEDAVMIEADCRPIGNAVDFSDIGEDESVASTNQQQLMELSFESQSSDGTSGECTPSDPMIVSFHPGSEELIDDQMNSLDQRQDPLSRKQRNLEWLRSHVTELQQLSHRPFSSVEMWTLHRHYFSLSIAPSAATTSGNSKSNASCAHPGVTAFSFTYDGRDKDSNATINTAESDVFPNITTSEPCMSGSTRPLSVGMTGNGFIHHRPPITCENSMLDKPVTMTRSSMPVGLGRKVSYRSLLDAVSSHQPPPRVPLKGRGRKISTVIEEGVSGSLAMQPQSKRARSNRSLISFLSRIKIKLDSYLEIDHYKALVLMRQLHYVENNFCRTFANDTFYTNKDLVQDVESILLDMM